MIPEIKKVAFGDIQINDESFGETDFFLFWDGAEPTGKTHNPSLMDLEKMLSRKPDVIIFGIGFNGLVKISDEIKKAAGNKIELHILSTPDALVLFQDLTKKGKKVAARIHSTC